MCEAVSMAMMGGATLLQGYMGYQSSRAEAKQLERQGELYEQGARRAEKQGLRDEESFRQQVRGFQGSQRAAIGSSGVVGTEGSAAAIQDDTAMQGEIDALNVRNNAFLEAWGLRTQGQMARQGAKLKRYEGRGTLLTSALSGSAYGARALSASPLFAPAAGG